jgi:hypothetical protein
MSFLEQCLATLEMVLFSLSPLDHLTSAVRADEEDADEGLDDEDEVLLGLVLEWEGAVVD